MNRKTRALRFSPPLGTKERNAEQRIAGMDETGVLGCRNPDRRAEGSGNQRGYAEQDQSLAHQIDHRPSLALRR